MELTHIDINKLNTYVMNGLIITQKHPSLPLLICNYSRKTQFEGLWDDYTMSCRGLIIELDGKIIGKTYKKFLNIEQHKPEEIPNLPFEVFNKEDGSLLIIFYYNGEWHTATRGSFNSDQSIKGMEFLKTHDISLLDPKYTFLGECVYKSNQIVCNYGDFEGIILHGVINTSTGDEMSYDDIIKNYSSNFTIVKRYDGLNDLSKLRDVEESNREGYVIRFSNGFKIKAKFSEYVRLHQIVTNVSNVVIWEYLKDNKLMDELIERTPDEWDEFVKSTIKDLKREYILIENKHANVFNELTSIKPELSRKEFAERVFSLTGYNSKILFDMLAGKDYSQVIYKMIKPKFSRPFLKSPDDE